MTKVCGIAGMPLLSWILWGSVQHRDDSIGRVLLIGLLGPTALLLVVAAAVGVRWPNAARVIAYCGVLWPVAIEVACFLALPVH